MFTIYKYQENFLIQSIHSFLLKIYQKKLHAAVCVKDPNYWNQILWNRDFLPHGIIDDKYQRILICNQEYDNINNRKLVLIYTDGENIELPLFSNDVIIFMPCEEVYHSLDNHKVYCQDNKGKWCVQSIHSS